MKVYHESYLKVDKINLTKCKPNKDFGKGFYVTKFRHHAEEDAYSEEWLDFVVINRDKNAETPTHDYDIVIGPVADDKVQATLRLYLKGKIPKDKFLQMLTYHEETNQICFCTLNSLQTIDRIDDTPTYDIVMISEPIIKKLVENYDMDEEKATNLFFASKTFDKLSNDEAKLYEKGWNEIYNLIISELRL
ncbi:MAG: DUF3990 domain-containing protein [Prevotellaceae bacterium]|jgi:hypothetical protein|nr:DUF3990 domain-containing protein [Prevotellaceae bacterium]